MRTEAVRMVNPARGRGVVWLRNAAFYDSSSIAVAFFKAHSPIIAKTLKESGQHRAGFRSASPEIGWMDPARPISVIGRR